MNAAGGVLGRQLTLRVMDHRGNPARGEDNIRTLASDTGCLAVIGGVHTPVVLAELSVLHDLKLPMLIQWAAGTPLIDNGYKPNYVFRLFVRDELAGHFMVGELRARSIERVGLLLERTGGGAL